VVTDHIFCPTFIDDFALALKVLIENDASGTYHTVGGESMTPYEVAIKISEIFNLDKNLISKITR
jgi:dTDP-4-dehydrorhamnose reductase